MAVAELGPFAQGFASWRRILGTVPQEAQLKIFGNAVEEVAGFVARGLDRAAAADELADMATSIGFDDPDAVQTIIAHAFANIEYVDVVPDQPAPGNGQAEPRHATRYVAPDPATIPKRAWLYGGHYIRQTASATVAPGGFGKTTLQLFEAIEMVKDGLRIWYLSGEDPRVELDRRIAAHCEQHKIALADLPGQLFVDDRATFPLQIAKSLRAGAIAFDETALAEFEHAIMLDQIDGVILDPFVSFHTVPENDNNGVDAVVKRLAQIASRTNSAIEISHHVRKASTAGAGGFRPELTVDDARGGSAIINAVRSGRVINRMSSTEAEQAKVDPSKKNFYVRVDIGKRNMAPPPDKATWFCLVGVTLPNGDYVQALEPWTFPGLMDELSVEDTEHIRELVRQRNFRADPRSDQWLGIEVAKRMRFNPELPADIRKIQKIIGVWLRNGVFAKKEMREEDSRKKRMFYVAPDQPAEPDNVVQLFPAAPPEEEPDP
jgi:AAA domain-containing protein